MQYILHSFVRWVCYRWVHDAFKPKQESNWTRLAYTTIPTLALFYPYYKSSFILYALAAICETYALRFARRTVRSFLQTSTLKRRKQTRGIGPSNVELSDQRA
jgi:hypothetical protein